MNYVVAQKEAYGICQVLFKHMLYELFNYGRVVDSGVGVMVAEAEEDEVEGEVVLKAGVVVEEDAVLVEVVVEEGVVEVAVVAVEVE
ncbi:uncharacterized protein A4U43_C03F29500 [Asparagus officinalis]|uniref:Uncharacterized protein n=1 Tax=Asparagus officinalis TaxID=4686 RepID=A0A5P1FDU2_ASPOF|nr:uncharacterized protein A4U43_C03F29500 [Asparagus officinalis]